MKKLYLLFLFSFFVWGAAFAQISVTATQATTGPTAYTTLKAAFDAINAGTHKGAITIAINGNTTETATATLNASSGTASYTSVAINSTGAFSVSGNLAPSLISFNGATNVNLNGNNTLQIVNTSTTGSTIAFAADASNNTIRNSIIKGSTASFTGTATSPTINSGVVAFNTGTTTGNDNNTIDNCEVDGSNNAICLIYSSGTTSTVDNTGFNSGNTIKSCRLHDFVNSTIAGAVAINLSANNTDWIIQDNSIYQVNAVNTTMQFVITGMQIFPAFTNDKHTVTGNFIGGNAPTAAGTMLLNGTATNALGFQGMTVQTGGTGNLVQNNTVRNINLTYTASAGSFTNAGISLFIGGYNGTSTVNNNTVSNVTVVNNAGFISFQGIHANGRVTTAGATVQPTFNITNNNINNITGNAGGVAGDVSITCVRLETSSAANLATGTDKSNPVFNVTGNNINTITNNFSGIASSVVRGIGTVATQGASSTSLLHPKLNISNNTIHTITTASGVGTVVAGNSNYAIPVISGIHFGGFGGATPNTTDIISINGNTIYNLSGTRAVDSGYVVTGILASSGILEITRNKIYDIRNAATGTNLNPGIIGINVRRTDGTANSLVANNFVSLGNNVTGNVQLFGILNNFVAATGPLNIYYNSVVITGAGVAGNAKTTAAFLRGTETLGANVTTPVNIRNNIFYNNRTSGGSHYAIANTHSAPTTGFTSAYNNLYSSLAGTVALWTASQLSLASYATSAGDATSKLVPVAFANVAIGDLHLAGGSVSDVNLKAIPIAGITTDIDGDTRDAATPTMGADEGTTVCIAPAITTQPAAQAACIGGNASFTVTATGTGLTYQWRKGGVNIAGATNATYTITGVAAGDAANYDVVISNGCGTATSNAVALSLNAATAITTQPLAQASCTGGSATFTVAATGTGTLTYQWRKAAVNIAGATSASYTIPSVAAGDAANYDVIVTGTCGSVTSNAVALTITPATAITTQPVNQSACTGSAVNFTVTATGAGLTYQWRKGGVNIAGATSATYNIAAAAAGDAGSYDVVVTGTCGSVTSNAATLTLNAAPVINTQPTAQTGCVGGNATFTVAASGSGLTYQWRKAGVNIAGATSASYTINNLTAGDAANYDVVITTSCATTVTSNAVALTVNPATAITTQPTAQTVCAGANASFTVAATGTGLTYQWRKDGTAITGATSATYTITAATAANAGSYTVVVTGTCGNVTSNAATLTVNAATTITTQPAAVTVCAGAPASFTVAAGGAGLTYQWRKGGVNIAGATNATYTIAATATADAGSYDVVVTGTCGNATSTAAVLTVNTGTGCTTAVPNIDADVTAATLMPNVISSTSMLRLEVRRSMRSDWTVSDANGRVVMSFSRQLTAGRNDINLSLPQLSAGTYTLVGSNSKGRIAILRFVKR